MYLGPAAVRPELHSRSGDCSIGPISVFAAVEQGRGMGHTLNFKSAWSWVMIALFALSIPAMILVLP
jgi:hypothetical protein